MGSQRLLGTQSADFTQQPDLAAQMAAASEQEVAAALAALRLGASPSQALSALGSNGGEAADALRPSLEHSNIVRCSNG